MKQKPVTPYQRLLADVKEFCEKVKYRHTMLWIWLMTPRKHAELIKAWADGAEVQFRSRFGECWENASDPLWLEDGIYRLKPVAKPDTVEGGHAAGPACSAPDEALIEKIVNLAYDNDRVIIEWAISEYIRRSAGKEKI